MDSNQTAKEIATEYENMAIESANQYCRLKDQRPFDDFSALSKHVAFCTLMYRCWDSVARDLDKGPNIYGADDDRRDYYGEYGI